jgi:hypothetical protein
MVVRLNNDHPNLIAVAIGQPDSFQKGWMSLRMHQLIVQNPS